MHIGGSKRLFRPCEELRQRATLPLLFEQEEREEERDLNSDGHRFIPVTMRKIHAWEMKSFHKRIELFYLVPVDEN